MSELPRHTLLRATSSSPSALAEGVAESSRPGEAAAYAHRMADPADIPPRLGRVLKQGTRKAKGQACELRKKMSKPEVYLWLRLKNAAAGGFLFRRQYPVGPYIADFYCHQARLVIEVDGAVHARRRSRDQSRDAWIANVGIATARFDAAFVLRETDAVAARIVHLCRERAEQIEAMKTPPPSRPPSGRATPSAGAEGDDRVTREKKMPASHSLQGMTTSPRVRMILAHS